ncbi:MAG: ABC transporter substrate-binding protein [Micavibrio aeruginosavorus]|uniref:ABC transporter substrate-binding protein n=1 Tax=Micavibrio aeruginosavorus TaxID=349221 RepID=A0A2W5FNQ2_9BACT|nr:MAG: ABC transporter substrate-binding protein [Micavibrio aeruginosavorus]
MSSPRKRGSRVGAVSDPRLRGENRLVRLLFLFVLFIFYSHTAIADGLSMHGEPALKEGFTSLPYAKEDAPKGGELKQSALGSFDTLNPFTIKGKAAQGLNYVYDRLMARSWDEAFTLYPLIAESIDVPDDRSSITFYLNPAAKFSDGTPITTDDVLFSFNTLKEKGRPNMRAVYKLVDKVEKFDQRSVKFTLGPVHDRETVMIIAMMPVLSKAYWSDKTFDTTTLDIPVTSGPYKIASIDPGRRIVLERNKEYWAKDLPVNKGLYNFDRITTDYFRDDSVALEAFKKGDLSLRVEQDPGRWAKSYSASGPIIQENLKHGRVERMWGMIFNLRRSPFDDIRVRKALSLMIDYDWINKNIFYGSYKPTNSFFANSNLAASGSPDDGELKLLEPYKSKLPQEVFGPAWKPENLSRDSQRKADALLKEAGWIIKDGKRINAKTGKTFSFEILLGSADDEKIALAFKRSLARLGINVNMRTLDAAAFNDRLLGYEYDMTLYFWQNTLSPGTEQMLYWGCQSAKQPGRFNYSGFCHPASDAIAGNIPKVKTREELLTSTHALDRILTWEHIAIPLFYSGKDMVASSPSITHPEKAALYGNTLESWYHK